MWTEIPCERSCRHPTPDCSDAVNVRPGCACPHDQFWDGETCVPDRDQCTCLHDGVLYHDGQVRPARTRTSTRACAHIPVYTDARAHTHTFWDGVLFHVGCQSQPGN